MILTPGPGKRSADDQNFLLLQELYSKIWNRKDLTPTLFREVEVTRAHYDKLQLQGRLNRKYPDRTSIVRRYLSDRLDILKWTNFPEALLPRHSDNNEERMDDNDMEAGGTGTRAILKSSHPLSAIWISQRSS